MGWLAWTSVRTARVKASPENPPRPMTTGASRTSIPQTRKLRSQGPNPSAPGPFLAGAALDMAAVQSRSSLRVGGAAEVVHHILYATVDEVEEGEAVPVWDLARFATASRWGPHAATVALTPASWVKRWAKDGLPVPSVRMSSRVRGGRRSRLGRAWRRVPGMVAS